MLKALDQILLFVTDAEQSRQFYEALGFTTGPFGQGITFAKLGDFQLLLMDPSNPNAKEPIFQKEAAKEPKGAGLYMNIQVEKIDKYYKSLIEKGLTPSSEPRDWPWGNREFAIRDPDRYKLVFYQASTEPRD